MTTHTHPDRLYGAIHGVNPPRPAPRPRLTPHQRDVYRDLCARYRYNCASRARMNDYIRSKGGEPTNPEPRPVAASAIGSRAALEHLVDKGYAVRTIEYGPRGGEHRFYTPIGGLL